MHINSEEWFHLNFFARDAKHMGTVVVANTTNPAMSRNKELLKYANELHRPLAVITDGSAEDFNNEPATYIKVPVSKYPISMPLTHFCSGMPDRKLYFRTDWRKVWQRMRGRLGIL